MKRKTLLATIVLMAVATVSAFCFEWTDVSEQTNGNIYSKNEMFTSKITVEQLEKIIINHAGALNSSEVTTGKLPSTSSDCLIVVQHTYGARGKKTMIDTYSIAIYSNDDYVVYIPKEVNDKKNTVAAKTVVDAGTMIFGTVGAFLTEGNPLVQVIALAADLTASAAIDNSEKSFTVGITNEYIESIFLPDLEIILANK